jgi:cytidylate kinase
MVCRVVCISHATGAGGDEIGRRVAERLGFLYVDDEIVAQAAAKGGISAEDVADEERRKSFAARMLEAMAHGGGEAWTMGAVGPTRFPDDLRGDDVRALIREAIEQTAARGNVVIVAHAASHAVPPGRQALRVLVTGSPETRAARVGDRAVKDADAARRDYLRRFYDVDEELPTHYDLVVNTDVLSAEQAADLIAHAGSS